MDERVVTTPDRRAYYAALIKHVHLLENKALGQAIARGNDYARHGSSGSQALTRRALRLTRLTTLCLKPWKWVREQYTLSQDWHKLYTLLQAPYERYIDAEIEELRCYLSPGVMGRLEDMLAPPRALQHDSAGGDAQLWQACANRSGRPSIRLRKLRLYGPDDYHISILLRPCFRS